MSHQNSKIVPERGRTSRKGKENNRREGEEWVDFLISSVKVLTPLHWWENTLPFEMELKSTCFWSSVLLIDYNMKMPLLFSTMNIPFKFLVYEEGWGFIKEIWIESIRILWFKLWYSKFGHLCLLHASEME